MRASIATTLTLVSLASSQQVGDGCKDVHVFLARGNNEPYPGRQGKLITAICSGLDSCDYEDIQFYNPLESPYCDSVMEGAKNGNSQIVAYNEKCPDSMLVVSGYSQGGHVVGDVLGGGGGVFFQDCVQSPNPALDPESPAGSKSKETCNSMAEGECLTNWVQLSPLSSLETLAIQPASLTTSSTAPTTTACFLVLEINLRI